MDIGIRIDALYALRAKRLELEKVVEEHKQQEQNLRAEILAQLNDAGLRGAKGMTATVAITHKTKPQVTDWTLVYDYIRETGNLELLHKRVTEGLWSSMREDGIDIPGIEAMTLTDLSLTKGSK